MLPVDSDVPVNHPEQLGKHPKQGTAPSRLPFLALTPKLSLVFPTDDLSQPARQLVQHISVHDAEEDEECRGDGGADDSSDAGKVVEA